MHCNIKRFYFIIGAKLKSLFFAFLFAVLFIPSHAVEIRAGGGDVSGGGGEASGGAEFGLYNAGAPFGVSLQDLSILNYFGQQQLSGTPSYILSNKITDILKYYKLKTPAPLDFDYLSPFVQKIDKLQEFQKKVVGANRLHELGYSGKGQSVVIIDSGISPYFRGIDKVVFFKDFVGDCPKESPCDGNSHGTFIADIIYQIAPGSSLIVLKVLDSNAKGDTDNIVKALKWVRKNKKKYNIKAVNLSVFRTESMASHFYDWRDELREAITSTIQKDIQVVVCSGNQGADGSSGSKYSIPANIKESLVVGSVYHQFSLNSLSHSISPFTSFSSAKDVSSTNFGGIYSHVSIQATNSELKPDLFAPGELVLAQVDTSSPIYERLISYSNRILDKETGLALLSGSSFAGPFVTAGIALLAEAYPEVPGFDIRLAMLDSSPPPSTPTLQRGDTFIGLKSGLINLEDTYEYLKRWPFK